MFKPLPSLSPACSIAVQEGHVQRKCWSWPLLVLHTEQTPCALSVLAHQAPLAVALAGGCAEQGGLAGVAQSSAPMFRLFQMVSMWELAVSQGFCWAVGELWPEMRLFPAVVSQV